MYTFFKGTGMLKAISDSVEKLCDEILDVKLQHGKSFGKGFYGSSIGLFEDDKEAYYYLFLKKDTINEFAEAFLGIKCESEDELNDLTKEVSNLIVGSAKAYLDDKHPDKKFKLGTPEFLGKISYPFPIKLDDFSIYKLKNRTFVLGVKKP